MVFVVPDKLDNIKPGLPNATKYIEYEDLWKAIRKLSNEAVRSVVEVLYNSDPLTFNAIQKETGLSVNDLNHVLYDMRRLNLIITTGKTRGERGYLLTKYCLILVETLKYFYENLSEIENYNVFSPAGD